MSCYFRHMKDVLDEVGIEVTPKNKKEVDRVIHGMVDVQYKNCSPAWAAIKERIKADPAAREDFVRKLTTRLKAAGLV